MNPLLGHLKEPPVKKVPTFEALGWVHWDWVQVYRAADIISRRGQYDPQGDSGPTHLYHE